MALHEAAVVSKKRQVVLGRGHHLCFFVVRGAHIVFFTLSGTLPRGAVCLVALGTSEVRQHLVPFFGLFAGATPTCRGGRVLQGQNSRLFVRNEIQLDGGHQVRRDLRGATTDLHVALVRGGQEAVSGRGGNTGSRGVCGVSGYGVHFIMSITVHARDTRLLLLPLVQIVNIQADGVFKVARSLGHSGGPGLRGRPEASQRIQESGARRTVGLHAHHRNGLMQILHDTRGVLVRLEFSEGTERDVSSTRLNNRILLVWSARTGSIGIARTKAAVAISICIMVVFLVKNFSYVRIL